jgi:hypothetical protein
MEQRERIQFWTDLADGRTPLRDVLGLSEEGIEKAIVLARTSYETGRFDQAAAIFKGLEALEPDRPEHSLHRAYAELKAGRAVDARASVERFLSHQGLADVDRDRGLAFRELIQRSAP